MSIETHVHKETLFHTSEAVRCYSEVGDYEGFAFECDPGWSVYIFDNTTIPDEAHEPELLFWDHANSKEEALDILAKRMNKL